MTLVSSLSIAQQALSVNQAAITIVSNNIANVDNENYSKLRVNLSTVVNNTPTTNNISLANTCSGVQISKIQRYADAALQSYYQDENSTYSYLDKYTSVISNIEELVNELNDTGLSQAFTKFYDAADALADNPSDITARQNYINTAENVCNIFNTTYQSMGILQEGLVGDPLVGDINSSEISSTVDAVNSLIEQLADVNADIMKTSISGSTQSALLDQRDMVLNQISSYIPIEVKTNDNGTVRVSLGTHELVNRSNVNGLLQEAIGTTAEPAIINIVDKDNNILFPNVNNEITGGTIGAILDVCGSDSTKFNFSGVLNDLNTLANGFAQIMNNIQVTVGYPSGDGSVPMCIDSATGQLTQSFANIFVSSDAMDPVISARTISLNSAVVSDTNLIAASRVSAVEFAGGAYQNNIGNNSNMIMVSDSRNTGYATLGNSTVEGFLSNLVSGVGSEVSSINNRYENQALVMKSVESNLSSKKGVNLDEELMDLIKYQRAYQAAARVFGTCNDIMDELMNLGR